MRPPPAARLPSLARRRGTLIDPKEFEEGIAAAAIDDQPLLRRMFEWATALEAEGVVRLLSYRGSTGRTTLLPYLTNDDAGFLTVWNDTNGASISLWRSVSERHTPELMPTIEELIAPVALGRGRTVRMSDELLSRLWRTPIAEAAPYTRRANRDRLSGETSARRGRRTHGSSLIVKVGRQRGDDCISDVLVESRGRTSERSTLDEMFIEDRPRPSRSSQRASATTEPRPRGCWEALDYVHGQPYRVEGGVEPESVENPSVVGWVHFERLAVGRVSDTANVSRQFPFTLTRQRTWSRGADRTVYRDDVRPGLENHRHDARGIRKPPWKPREVEFRSATLDDCDVKALASTADVNSCPFHRSP